MSEVGGGLEQVILAHQRIPMYDGSGGQRCTGCDNLRGETDGPNSPRHAAHVAAEVRAWIGEALAGDGLRAEVAEELDHPHWCESNYTRGCTCRDDRLESARAALSAVRDHLAGDADGLGEVGRS